MSQRGLNINWSTLRNFFFKINKTDAPIMKFQNLLGGKRTKFQNMYHYPCYCVNRICELDILSVLRNLESWKAGGKVPCNFYKVGSMKSPHAKRISQFAPWNLHEYEKRTLTMSQKKKKKSEQLGWITTNFLCQYRYIMIYKQCL